MKAILFDGAGKILSFCYPKDEKEALKTFKYLVRRQSMCGFFSVSFIIDDKEYKVKEFYHLSTFNKAFNKILNNILLHDLSWFKGEETFEFVKKIKEECPYEFETAEEIYWYQHKLLEMDKNELIELAKKFH